MPLSSYLLFLVSATNGTYLWISLPTLLLGKDHSKYPGQNLAGYKSGYPWYRINTPLGARENEKYIASSKYYT